MNTQLGHLDIVYQLKTAIRKTEKQMITFRDYMDICLYSEPNGYYRNARLKIGKDGDFYTSSSIGSVMGEVLASFIIKQIQTNEHRDSPIQLVEWGGGNGRLALHLLDEIKGIASEIYERLSYTMIESSGYHRQAQRETLESHAARVRFLSEEEWFSNHPTDGVYVLANELLDAFPVHRVRYQDEKYCESFVVWNEQVQAFEESWIFLDSKPLLDYIARLNVQWIDGQIFEVNLAAETWLSTVVKQISSGSIIIIDYGDDKDEIYSAHRQQGTLMCYRKHQAHGNPFMYQGDQDITSHVNFTSCMDIILQNGFKEFTLQTQREFLVEHGVLQKLQNHFDPNPFSDISKRNRAIRQLLLSDKMSELFKVLVAIKKR
ncbi:SAM-dependent methyltransferase [Paenibacillus sp. SYP-B3998]|uniref:SAM-dependent methyltransferase n=1 Tax=Paenibacillus sp. SYP-B3998 TaxID=2678564 RepID=A0A6G3ZSY5_9BACL|nr:SAM-dependent methyltransferase [Paenibacillus sp. SYP-B3998]NEW05252.1 SAM-dependent methyltransferase [Paenibacillus sp. SYP-B3998]